MPWFVSAQVDRIFACISWQTEVWSEPNQEVLLFGLGSAARRLSPWWFSHKKEKKKEGRKKAKCTLNPGHNKFQQTEFPDLTTSSGLSLP